MISVKVPKSVFNEAYLPHLNNRSRVQIGFGGSSSGKSKFYAQRAIWHMLEGGHNYLICRQTKTSLRGSVITEVTKVINEWGLAALFNINKTDGTITCKNGYQIVFAGLDDVEKLKSIAFQKGVLTDIWVEEATETELKTIKQLMKRQRGKTNKTNDGEIVRKTITLSFNPILQQHWIYEEYFSKIAWADTQKEYKSDRLSIIKTTYKDNRFLEQDDINDLENETDKYFYDVYTLGNWGILGNVIFTKWIIANLDDPNDPYYLPENQRTNPRDGLDFGFAKDPAAWAGSHYDKKHERIYIFDEIYETELDNEQLAELLKTRAKNRRIICDSAEPKSISELCKYGVNAVGAKKGPDSVRFGIKWLQKQTIIIDTKCVNMRKEVQQYKWKEDANGNVISPPRPVEKNDHLIDGGLRYAYEDDMTENKLESHEDNPFYD